MPVWPTADPQAELCFERLSLGVTADENCRRCGVAGLPRVREVGLCRQEECPSHSSGGRSEPQRLLRFTIPRASDPVSECPPLRARPLGGSAMASSSSPLGLARSPARGVLRSCGIQAAKCGGSYPASVPVPWIWAVPSPVNPYESLTRHPEFFHRARPIRNSGYEVAAGWRLGDSEKPAVITRNTRPVSTSLAEAFPWRARPGRPTPAAAGSALVTSSAATPWCPAVVQNGAAEPGRERQRHRMRGCGERKRTEAALDPESSEDSHATKHA